MITFFAADSRSVAFRFTALLVKALPIRQARIA
jgi:hypothetical protein